MAIRFVLDLQPDPQRSAAKPRNLHLSAAIDEDAVFDAVAQLVSAGEYLDTIPGRPGVDVDGGGVFPSRTWRRDATPVPARVAPVRAGERTRLDRAATAAATGAVGYGGAGGLRGGHTADGVTATTYLEPGGRQHTGGPAIPLLLCDRGCGITSQTDLADGPVRGNDPSPAPNGVNCCFPQAMTVADWFGRWLEGTLYQPWLVQDPNTGTWRGATDAEYTAELNTLHDDD